MLTMENKRQNSAASSPPILAAKNSLPLDQGHPVDYENSNPPPPNEEPSMNTGDWRTQLPPDARRKNANKIVETLKKHVPSSGQEGIDELMRIGVSFEELTSS